MNINFKTDVRLAKVIKEYQILNELPDCNIAAKEMLLRAYVFKEKLSNIGCKITFPVKMPMTRIIVEALQENGPMTQSAILRLFGGHTPAAIVREALAELLEQNIVDYEKICSVKRPVTIWKIAKEFEENELL